MLTEDEVYQILKKQLAVSGDTIMFAKAAAKQIAALSLSKTLQEAAPSSAAIAPPTPGVGSLPVPPVGQSLCDQIADIIFETVETSNERGFCKDAAEEILAHLPRDDITVSVGCMKETNGRNTWVVSLYRGEAKGLGEGLQVYSSPSEGRARYHAEEYKCLFGQAPRPDILAFDPTIPPDQLKFYDGPPATLEALVVWFASNVFGPAVGTSSAVAMHMERRHKASRELAEKIAKAFPGIVS
jgi:hypothetical protein